MSDLPILVLSRIFSYLSLKERLKLRLVSKLWKALLEEIHQENLCICDRQSHWKVRYDEEDFFEISESEKSLNFDYFLNPDFNQRIKRLIILADHRHGFLLDFNLFSQLEVLKIYDCFSLKFPVLNLPNLRTLCLIYTTLKCDLRVNSPNLSSLTFYNNDLERPTYRFSLLLERPEQVKFLQCRYFNEMFEDLANLEHLIAMQIRNPLDRFTKLKRIEIFSLTRPSAHPAIKDLEKNRNLFSPNLKVFMNGFEWPPPTKILKMKNSFGLNFYFSKKDLKEILNNLFAITRPFQWRVKIDYIDCSFPDNFFDLFKQIEKVSVSCPVESERLIRFLQKAATVAMLDLENSFLDQSFYNQLPLIQTIRILNITDCKQSLNFDFLYELVNLASLYLDAQIIPIKILYKKLIEHKCFFSAFCTVPEQLAPDLRYNFPIFVTVSIRKLFRIKTIQNKAIQMSIGNLFDSHYTHIAIDELVSTLETDDRVNKFLV